MLKLIKLSLCLIISTFTAIVYSETKIQNADKSVVRVITRSGVGSGFVISNNGNVVTNNHVIKNENEILIVNKGSDGLLKKTPASIVWSSEELDLAVLIAPNLIAPPIELNTQLPVKGDKVITIGFPEIANLAMQVDIKNPAFVESTVTEGVVGRIIDAHWKNNTQNFKIIQHSAPVNRGNSGGPLVDECGRLVGINTRKAFGTLEINGQDGINVIQSDGIFYASHASNLLSILAGLNIDFKQSNEDCQKTGNGIIIKEESNYNIILFTAAGLTAIIAIIAIIISLKKPAILTESFTNYQKRKKIKNDSQSKNKTTQPLKLKGKDSSGKALIFNLDEASLNRGKILIGRDHIACRFYLNDLSVSRKHAEFCKFENDIKIRDLESKNGTYLNSIRIKSSFITIKLGDKLKFGDLSFELIKE